MRHNSTLRDQHLLLRSSNEETASREKPNVAKGTGLLSRLRPNRKKQAEQQAKRNVQKMPELEDYLHKRDYAGAISLLEFSQKDGESQETTALWLGFCYFRAGDFKKASDVYENMLTKKNGGPEVGVYLGCCLFFLGMYTEARVAAEKAPKSFLQNRLLFHVAHKLNDEKRLMTHHQQLGDSLEDQLSLASIHFMRMHYNEAVSTYKNILTTSPSLIALNFYMAMCYYKMDYYEVAQDVLAVFLKVFPDSPAALNLKACITYKAYTGKSVVTETEQLLRTNLYPAARDLIRHNLVVFKNGDGALQVLPSLMDTFPEARLNMILYYLKKGLIQEAMSLCNDLEPQLPYEFLIKATTFTFWGLQKDSKDHLRTAEQFFQMVGESSAECDTIPGRQSMASTYFLQQKFDEVLLYMNSIKEYHQQDDLFSLNFAQALLMAKQYKEAEEEFLKVTVIFNKKPHFAWDLFVKTSDQKDALGLMRVIAHDCYKVGEYYYAAKAYDQLEKADPSPENWQGKRGATAGLFHHLARGKCTPEQMHEVLLLVETSHHPHAEFLASVIRKWAKNHNIKLE
ncbi:unnamed protein product [Caenorhabditis auriculariae]|uniref:Intraflagellar transport protein 56 n=1 Tax=Caenorhabditis auriculariae TaxID=2777116 RepID=A0A8S1HAW5_9PELO|nr:unnamed protein product [Caenorhabditis auriculariae]